MGLIAIVEEAGYQAVEAADADQAVAILERRTDIRIVLSASALIANRGSIPPASL